MVARTLERFRMAPRNGSTPFIDHFSDPATESPYRFDRVSPYRIRLAVERVISAARATFSPFRAEMTPFARSVNTRIRVREPPSKKLTSKEKSRPPCQTPSAIERVVNVIQVFISGLIEGEERVPSNKSDIIDISAMLISISSLE